MKYFSKVENIVGKVNPSTFSLIFVYFRKLTSSVQYHFLHLGSFIEYFPYPPFDTMTVEGSKANLNKISF